MSEEPRDLEVQETEKQVAETDTERMREQPAFVPQTDIYENTEAIMLVANMPGVDETSIEITLEKNVLTINGCVEDDELEGYGLAHAEYRVGDYVRSFSLSNEIDQTAIEATVKDGVLRLRLPKITEAQTKQIAVKAG